MRFTWFSLAVAGLLFVGSLGSPLVVRGQASQIQVALVFTPGSNMGSSEVEAQLLDSTEFDFAVTILTPAEIQDEADLAPFDVLVLGDSGYQDINLTLVNAQAILAWARSGGGVVTTGWFDYEVGAYPVDAARDALLDEVMPINALGTIGDTYCTTPHDLDVLVSHPVTAGLTDFSLATADYVELSPFPPDSDNGQVLVVDTGTCEAGPPNNVVVIGTEGDGRLVFLGPIYLARQGIYEVTELRSGPADQLLEQAVAWAAGDRRRAVNEQPVRPRPPSIGAGLSGLFNGQPTPLPGAPQAGSAGSPAAGTSPAATSPVITPPRTGDAGLASTSTSTLFLPALLVTGGLIGLLTIHIRTTRARR